MVNVAGRSKGCAVCRRRKVKVRQRRRTLHGRTTANCHKCDLRFPQCQRCIDMRLDCPGPRLGTIFVHTQVAPEPPGVQALTRLPPTAAVQACRADAFDQLFVAHFIDSFGLPRYTGAGPTWLESLPVFFRSRDALASASIRSASMLSYGTWARDESIQADSYRWYASALAQLGRAVAHDRPVTMDMAVCAAVMLVHFETWAGTSRNAWMHHVKGAASLLVAAGPAACRMGFLHSVFSHLRLQVFIATMQENTLHAFAEGEWMEVPFRERGKMFFDELVDGLFSVQRCLVAAMKNEAVDVPGVQDLVRTASQKLADWKAKYMALLKLPMETANVEGTNDKLIKMSDAQPTGLPEAALVSLYHAALLILTQLSAPSTGPSGTVDHGEIILRANKFVSEHSKGAASKMRPFMMLPSLKVASLWSPSPDVRAEAGDLLHGEQFFSSPLADLALTTDGFFASVANTAFGVRNSSHE